MLGSARQRSLVLGGSCPGGRTAAGGGRGRDVAPGPGVATRELALASEMNFTLRSQRVPSGHPPKHGARGGFHFKAIIGKFGPEPPSSTSWQLQRSHHVKICSSVWSCCKNATCPDHGNSNRRRRLKKMRARVSCGETGPEFRRARPPVPGRARGPTCLSPTPCETCSHYSATSLDKSFPLSFSGFS